MRARTEPCAGQAWPKDALQAVARKALQPAELAEEEREALVALCQDFHSTARPSRALGRVRQAGSAAAVPQHGN